MELLIAGAAVCYRFLVFLVVMCALAASQTVPTTAQDMYESVMDSGGSSFNSADLEDIFRQQAECENQMVNSTSNPEGEPMCGFNFDFFVCWPQSPPGETVIVECPDVIDHYQASTVSRECYPNGTWSYLDVDEAYFGGTVCYCSHCKPILVINMLGYSLSLLACIIASIIFIISKSLWCTRNLIHWHLISSFTLKYVIFILSAVIGSPPVWVSRLIETLLWYAEMTNYFWMFVEGFFLHTLVVFALKVDADRISFWLYCLIGWGTPAVFVSIWATISKIKYPPDSTFIGSTDSVPPHEYACVIGPILLVLLINCIFLLNIVRVLMSKLRGGGGAGSGGELEQYRRAAKATLVLVVLLGVTYIIFICLPFLENHLSTQGRMALIYINALLASTQGLAVATIYVFCNNEVRSVLRRRFRRWCPGVNLPCCGRRRRGLSPRHSYQTTMSTVMSVSTTDTWQLENSPVLNKKPNGNPGRGSHTSKEEDNNGVKEEKETIELTAVNDNGNNSNTQQGIRVSKDEVEPLMKHDVDNIQLVS